MSSALETITIDSLAYGGDSVGHIGEKVIFIPGCVPGDRVLVEVREDRGSFFRGTVKELISPSPERVEPFCPLVSRCGGCQWQAVSYHEQLRWKRTIVKESLRRLSGIGDVEVEPCLPSPLERGFRTVARYPAGNTRKGLVLGYYERRSHRIVDIDRCPVAGEGVNSIASYMKELFREHFPGIDIREITICSSHNQLSSLVTIMAGGDKKLSAAADRILADIPGLRGVIHRNTEGKHQRTSGERFRYESIGEKLFRIGEKSFFQSNVPQTGRLAGLVSEMLDLKPSDVIVDGYGGAGLFSLTAAPLDAVIHLYDLSGSAVKDSKFNARKMGFTAFTAHRNDTLQAAEVIGFADVVLLDPPRTGLGTEAVKAVSKLNARTIVYVSCNPATLARDLKFFKEAGYSIECVVPVDMFPHTYHIETVVKMRKMK